MSLAGCIGTSKQPFTPLQSGTLTFPEEAKQAGLTYGVVVVQYDILVDGTVDNLEVVSSDPPDVFDAEALRFMGTWRFRPAHEDGEAIETLGVESTIEFVLGDAENIPEER